MYSGRFVFAAVNVSLATSVPSTYNLADIPSNVADTRGQPALTIPPSANPNTPPQFPVAPNPVFTMNLYRVPRISVPRYRYQRSSQENPYLSE
jgi:hypothetical protein